MKNCSFCGATVRHGIGWSTVGMCDEHERIWTEDIASGFKQNRLRDIMVARGEVSSTNQINNHQNNQTK